jgi:hypothetical protein
MVIESHGKSSGKLDQEANQRDSTKAVEDVDMGRHILTADVIRQTLNLQTLLKPLIGLRVSNLLSKHAAIPKVILPSLKNVT